VASSAADARNDSSADGQHRPPTSEQAAVDAAVVARLVTPLRAVGHGDALKHRDAWNHGDAAAAAHGEVLVLTVDAALTDPPVGAALVRDHAGGDGPDVDATRTGDGFDGDPNDASAVRTHEIQPDEVRADDVRASDGGLDTCGVESGIIDRLDAAVEALDEVDFARWSDVALAGHLDEVSLVLCRVDAQLSRLADAVRSRGFAIAEVDLPLAS